MLATNEVLQQKRYRIIHRLEEDITSAIYEAYDSVLETNVMLKEIKVNLGKVATPAQQENRKLAFANEAKVLTEIKHESLLQVHDYFSEIDHHYLVMESVNGYDLSEFLEKDKKLATMAEILNWADQLLDALHCLHNRIPPIIHSNIKPQNIKLLSDGKVKLLNLDLAKDIDTNTNIVVKNKSFHSESLNYLPLEQIWVELDAASQKAILNSYDEKSEKILEQPSGARSDIYALGATLYHLATGRLPIDALERSIDILDGKADPLPALHKINPKIAPEISNVLMIALEIKRENRFSSAGIMRQMLRAALVKVKAREKEEAQKQEKIAAEIHAAKQKTLEEQRVLIEKEKAEQQERIAAQLKLEIEAEQKRQLELIEQRLRESEKQRIKAEQRAAAAEKQLLEKAAVIQIDSEIIEIDDSVSTEENNELLELSETDILIPPTQPIETFTQVIPPAENISPEAAEPVKADKQSSDEFDGIFTAPAKDNKIFKYMTAVVLTLLILGGAGWGIWNFTLSKPAAESNQPISSQSVSSNDETTPQAIVEPTPEPDTQQTTETNTTMSPPPEMTETAADSAELKNAPVLPSSSTKVKKQPTPAIKAPAAQKKTVTVEDIISDN